MSPTLCGEISALLIAVQALNISVLPLSGSGANAARQDSSISVNTASDLADGDTSSIENLLAIPGADGVVSLREAITAANNTPGPDSIVFQGAYVIELASALPSLDDDSGGTRIDGAGQVTLRGAPSPAALSITSSGNEVIGLTIIDSAEDGIRIDGAGASQNSVRGCRIGNDGAIAHPNAGHGIRIESASESTVGGEEREDGNVISGNAGYGVYIGGNGTVLLNNLIGTDAAGAAALPNGISGILMNGQCQIGSAELRAGNVISGNTQDGIEVTHGRSDVCYVEHNRIGVACDDDSPVPNGRHGIMVAGGNLQIGGSVPHAGNVIAFNGGAGVFEDGEHGAIIGILQNSIHDSVSEGIHRDWDYRPQIDWILPNHGRYWVYGYLGSGNILELFADAGGQGQFPLLSIQRGDSQTEDDYFRVSVDLSAYEGMNLTATSTYAHPESANMNTSPFSDPFSIAFAPRLNCDIACQENCDEPAIETNITSEVADSFALGGGGSALISIDILAKCQWATIEGVEIVERALEAITNPLHCCVTSVWAQNLATSQVILDAVGPPETPLPDYWITRKAMLVRVAAAIATAGSQKLFGEMREFLERYGPPIDPAQFDFSLEQYFAYDGDADVDGVCNLAEYLAAQESGDDYIANVLDPMVTDNGGGCFAPCYEAVNIGPDPCDTGVHSADQDSDGTISLSELLRLIQFFNSGGFTCAVDAAGTEDGFVPEPGINASCCAHDSDYFGGGADWRVGLQELLRMIQFFNSGGYHPCPGDATEDGYCPGPRTK